MLHPELKSKIRKLWDKFWSGGISNPLQAIEQISYLIYMKRLEDKEVQREQEAILKGIKYKSIFEGHEDCRWSEWSEYPAEKILDHVRYKVFKFMQGLGDDGGLYAKYMASANFEIPTASLIIEAVSIINDLHIKEQNQDAQGDIYEYLLSELQTAGKNGQFRTPRHIIQMMVELTKPELNDRILDPTCGTAGFLVNAYEYILKENTSKSLIKIDDEGNQYNFKADKLKPQQKRFLDEETIYGNDIDPVLTRIALMNLMMHGITKPNLKQLNTLSKRYNEENTYNLILANPPFKGSIDESEMSDNFRIKTKKTELLFLELMYNSLANGGRCAVIIPDGVLFGGSNAHKAIRKLILERCRLDAVISMPSGVFKPYAGVSTAVLFFTKGESTKNVWFYEMEADGFTLDDKRTKIKQNDIPEILERFEKRKKEDNEDRSKKHFFIPIEEIIKKDYSLSLSAYQKKIYKQEVYEEPSYYLDRFEKKIGEIAKNTKELKKLMK
ncbi:MAG: class I SAM-dependent DNA methyltransferase [Nanoarchaeota archaeon]